MLSSADDHSPLSLYYIPTISLVLGTFILYLIIVLIILVALLYVLRNVSRNKKSKKIEMNFNITSNAAFLIV